MVSQHVLRRPGEEYQENCACLQSSMGGGSIMVWGCIRRWYWGLRFIEGNMDSNVLWHSEAEDDALPSETVFPTWQPPTKHTTKMTTALLLKVKVKVMEWPSMSPDLNPIEHMWGILKRKVRSTMCLTSSSTVIHYGGVEEDASNNLCSSVNSMPRRIKAVLDNNGAPTKYWHFGHSFDVQLGCTHFCCL